MSVFGGMTWAFTPFGKELLLELVAAGLAYDLAVTMIHTEVENGRYLETDIYELPAVVPLEVGAGNE